MNMAKQIYYHRQRRRHQCDRLLEAMVGENLVAHWWQSPNQAFDLNTPESVFDTNPDQVYNYLMQHAGGDYS